MEFTLNIKPRTKKNSQRFIYNKKLGRTMIIPSKAYKEFEKEALQQIALLRLGDTIDYPCEVTCLFYKETRRKVDLTNLLEAIDDTLVKAKVLADDNDSIIVSHDGSRVYYDKEHPRIEVEIKRMGV